VLSVLHFTPNMVTTVGLVLTAGAAATLALGQLIGAGVLMLFAGVFDILDGALARRLGLSYAYGAFYDSTADRYAEGLVYLGMLAYFLQLGDHTREVTLVFLALLGSQLVSYVRARAQSLGFNCEGGLFARPERVVVTAVGLIFAPLLLTPVLFILAVLTNATALQRIWIVWRQRRLVTL
jgi:CDP-diacylglycerol--glycerol-3-phosphate 3-phosphatidyltransferase